MQNIYSGNNQTPETPKAASTPKANFRRYEDPTGEFTSGNLSRGLWWVKHKVLLYRLLVGALILISAIFLIFSLAKWGIYLVGIPNSNLLEKQAVQFSNYNPAIQHFNPVPLQIVSTNLFQNGGSKVDAVSEVENPNAGYIANFDYSFLISGTSTAPAKAIVLAKSRTMAAALGLTEISGSSGAVLQIKNLQWQRVSPHDIPDPKSWQDSRINFSISSTTFENALSTPGLSGNRLAFVLKNESAYGYKQPRFYVGLYNQDALVGVMPLQTDDFHSLETKNIDLRNFTSNLQVQNIQVFPLINIYDQNVYLPPER